MISASSARYWTRDIVIPEWTMDEDGLVPVPHDKPGLGVTVDTDFIDSLTVRTEEIRGASAMVAVS